jgi:hypothetical protein
MIRAAPHTDARQGEEAIVRQHWHLDVRRAYVGLGRRAAAALALLAVVAAALAPAPAMA